MSKGFGDTSHQKFPQNTPGEHPFKKLVREHVTLKHKSRISKFLQRHWSQLSALGWKGYLEMGRGALFLTIDERVFDGAGESLVEYVDERECFCREVMSGYQPMGEISQKVNTYDPSQEIITVFKWKSRRGYLVAQFKNHLTTPRQNYANSGLQADKSRFPLAFGVTEEQAAKNAKTYPLLRLVEEQWEVWAALAWKGYLAEGRGIVAVVLGKGFFQRMEKLESDLNSTVSTQEIPATYLHQDSAELHSLLKSSVLEAKEFLSEIETYDPQKAICVSFEWDGDETPTIQLTASNAEFSPPQCYERLKARLNEFSEVK